MQTDPSAASAATTEPKASPKQAEPAADVVAGADACAAGRAGFPLPDGWRVVCRLSRNDARSCWTTRPRPAAKPVSGGGSNCEAQIFSPGLCQPLRVPLQLVPAWPELQPGMEFLGRYEIRQSLSPVSGCSRWEVFDLLERTERALQVAELKRERDVQTFVDRYHLESMDVESRLFIRLRDVALALPGKLAVIEDLPRRTLWQEFDRPQVGTRLAAKIAAISASVLTGLRRIHEMGMAHGNVSVNTVSLALDGGWKLGALEDARPVKNMAELPSPSLGGLPPPEALLGLPLDEKVDVWQLAAALSEAILRQQSGAVATPPRAAPEDAGTGPTLCKLVDFLGPLPSALVARHPNREELFTPEGHLLRPTTPETTGANELEVIEPSLATALVKDKKGGDMPPRPPSLVKALEGVKGGPDVLDFLGRLLHPDPDQRPSAAQALALPFLQPPRGRCVSIDEGAEVLMTHKTNARAVIASGRCKTGTRMGGAFSQLTTKLVTELALAQSDLAAIQAESPACIIPQDENGVEKRKLAAAKCESEQCKRVPTSNSQAATANTAKKPLVPSELLDIKVEMSWTQPATASDSTKNDEGADDAKPGKKKKVGMRADDEDAKGTGKKGKGVSMAPEEDKKKHVEVGADKDDNQGHITRKGTGFVFVGELPPSDDEDSEEEEEKPKKKQVNVHAGIEEKSQKADNVGHVARKGTGFVHTGDLPESDEESEEEQKPVKKVQVSDDSKAKVDSKDGEEKTPTVVRKGTGFVHIGELPDTDDEDDDEEEDTKKHVAVAGSDTKEDGAGHIARKGTGFVHMGELNLSDDEDEEDSDNEKKAKHVQMASDAKSESKEEKGEAQPGAITRKGTGFVFMGELPQTDSEDEDSVKGDKSQGVKIVDEDPAEKKQDGQGHITRKGTGFVHIGELPDSDDDEEEEEAAPKHAVIQDDREDAKDDDKQESKLARKGTGYVFQTELPDFDDDEDDDEEEKKNVPKNVQIKETEKQAEKKKDDAPKPPIRKGTGFVNLSDLPDSDSGEDDDE
eukprot:gnl/TRDRNA2_/TRDRNA2_174511_c0_seq5.p1 gnl/TRDRNA2_/TRDRNA2_174511_c0~~gnl/TRDRNA2_/TRDRNA2_174511_c0_seq5.p1  ORF type:complete len:1027 (+),score=298.89 gnl/TRDRNA2_/TRDRNA2_174511_c0_seq5:144-3224(+)